MTKMGAQAGYGKNWWAVGYTAAMKATQPADFAAWIANSGEGCNVEAFMKGWHSVWRCERREEAEEIIATRACHT